MSPDRTTVRRALFDAIDWQESLAQAWPPGSPERIDAMAQARRYRAVLKRRYGSSATPFEEVFADAETVTLDDLRRKAQSQEPRE